MTNQEKARVALSARDASDQRWLHLVLMLSFATGLNPASVELEIEKLAKGGA